MMATDATRMSVDRETRVQCTPLDILWYFANSRSSVVYAGGSKLGLLLFWENEGDAREVTRGRCFSVVGILNATLRYDWKE